MSERRAKRPKISRGEEDYLPGNITEIEIHNFMTFSYLKCKPGSRLNLVIGPNGSGKSSIVCAIALGLGGDPQILGRAGSVGAYVKRGEESGHIKITLRGDSREERICITRKIDTTSKPEWLLNGKTVPKKYIIESVQRFNILINNLTQSDEERLWDQREREELEGHIRERDAARTQKLKEAKMSNKEGEEAIRRSNALEKDDLEALSALLLDFRYTWDSHYYCYRKVSRQGYLEKREAKKLEELRDEIED